MHSAILDTKQFKVHHELIFVRNSFSLKHNCSNFQSYFTNYCSNLLKEMKKKKKTFAKGVHLRKAITLQENIEEYKHDLKLYILTIISKLQKQIYVIYLPQLIFNHVVGMKCR